MHGRLHAQCQPLGRCGMRSTVSEPGTRPRLAPGALSWRRTSLVALPSRSGTPRLPHFFFIRRNGLSREGHRLAKGGVPQVTEQLIVTPVYILPRSGAGRWHCRPVYPQGGGCRGTGGTGRKGNNHLQAGLLFDQRLDGAWLNSAVFKMGRKEASQTARGRPGCPPVWAALRRAGYTVPETSSGPGRHKQGQACSRRRASVQDCVSPGNCRQ